jgi:hypothetical protein
LSCTRFRNLTLDDLEISAGLEICATFMGAISGTLALIVAIIPPIKFQLMMMILAAFLCMESRALLPRKFSAQIH